MNLEVVAPELRASLRGPVSVPIAYGWVRGLSRAAIRLMRPGPHPDVSISAERAGQVLLRVYRPVRPRSSAAVLWIHGGGLVIGHPKQDDRLCLATARLLGAVIVSVDYRLAPKHPFPAAHDDALAAWDWLQRATDLGVDPSRVVVGGQSAGGGLAAALVQHLHDRGGIEPMAQWLFAPMLDDRTAADCGLDTTGHPVWDNGRNRLGWEAYLRRPAGVRDLPEYAAPARREDLTGLPPAWVGVGDIELFHDEAVEYARRLGAAGVDTTLDVVPGAYHGFETIAAGSDLAKQYVGRAHQWLADVVRSGA